MIVAKPIRLTIASLSLEKSLRSPACVLQAVGKDGPDLFSTLALLLELLSAHGLLGLLVCWGLC